MKKGKMSDQQLWKGKYFSGARTEERIVLRMAFSVGYHLVGR